MHTKLRLHQDLATIDCSQSHWQQRSIDSGLLLGRKNLLDTPTVNYRIVLFLKIVVDLSIMFSGSSIRLVSPLSLGYCLEIN